MYVNWACCRLQTCGSGHATGAIDWCAGTNISASRAELVGNNLAAAVADRRLRDGQHPDSAQPGAMDVDSSAPAMRTANRRRIVTNGFMDGLVR